MFAKTLDLRRIALTAALWVSGGFALRVSKSYWAKCDMTHGCHALEPFSSYYEQVKQVLRPTEGDMILDAGCRKG